MSLQLSCCPLLGGGTSGDIAGVIEAGPPLEGGSGLPHFWLPDAMLLLPANLAPPTPPSDLPAADLT